jgi:hypothetical protein
VKGITGRILSIGENQAGLELMTIVNGMGTAAVYGEPATLLCTPHVQLLMWGLSSMCPSMHSSTSAVHALLCLLWYTIEDQSL